MRKDLFPGEQLIVSTRPQPRRLSLSAVAFIVAPAAAAFGAAWVNRGGAQQVFPALNDSWKPWLTGAFFVLAAWILVGFCLPRLLRWSSTNYTLTSQRVVAKFGLLKRRDQQVNLRSVRNVSIHGSVLQRMLRSGTISLEVGHQGVVTLQDVPEVARFREFILDAIDDLPEEYAAQPGHPASAAPWLDERNRWLREGGRNER